MTSRTWNGASADWNTGANWTLTTPGDGAPKPGDTAVVASGTVILTTDAEAADRLFETNDVTLGGAAGATLLLRNDQPTGRYYRVTIAGKATIEADGKRAFAGNITGNPNDGSTLTLKGDPGGSLELLNGGTFKVSDGTIDFEGNVTLERDATLSGNVVNNGTLSILSGTTDFATNGLSGTGTIAIGGNGTFSVEGFQFGGAHQTIAFAGAGATLKLSYQSVDYSGSVKDFAPGDFISFLDGDGSATTASLDTVAHRLTIASASGGSTVFNNFFGQAGALTDVRQSNGYDLIGYASAAPQLNYQIDAGARAMHADVAHTMTVPGTATPIDGRGVSVGIISDSFDVQKGAASDIANGYLPAEGVTVLREGSTSTGATDEGRAMAELIHQGAPGAKLYFASTGSGTDDFASSVQALQAAGCTVIVDDIGLGDEPFFQLGSPAENAISNAIAKGVTFVSSAGNNGNVFYQHAFAATPQTLVDGSAVRGMTFSNGTPYQSITATGGTFDTLDLQWDAPFYGTGGVATDQPDSLTVKVFNPTTNKLVATSSQVKFDGHSVAETSVDLPFSNSAITYNIAIYQNDGTPAVSEIKYGLSGESASVGVSGTFGSGAGGRINDPDAGVGSGAIYGHQLVPGVIAVAATDVTNTSAFGRAPDYSEYFTSTGPGELLFDAAGNRLAQPTTVGSPDVTGPDGIETSVTGFTPFYGTSAAAPNVAAVAALLQQVRPGIAPADVANLLAQSAIPLTGEGSSVAGAGLVQADRAILMEEQTVCFAAGTRIATTRGDVPVELLRIGDFVITASGSQRSIAWLGHRAVAVRNHPRQHEVQPIRIAAHAFAENRPARDLRVSPGHAICVDLLGEVLIPAGALVNGSTIVQEDVDHVTYWHVELEGGHDILLAENLPCESYLEMGNRGFFAESGVATLHAVPDVAVPTHADFCRPFHADGPLVAFVRERLAARPAELGWHLEDVPLEGNLYLEVDGVRLEPEVRGLAARFLVPADAKHAWLVSGTAVPAYANQGADPRALGVCVGAVTVDDGFGAPRVIGADDPSLCVGFHEIEEGPQRWTAGRARLPASLWDGCHGSVFLRVALTRPPMPRWIAPLASADEVALAG